MAAASSIAKNIYKKNDGKAVGIGKRTTIRGRITRLSVFGVLASIVTLTAFNLIMMYSSVLASSKSEIELLTISYSSAISNADITKNKNYLDEIFQSFDEVNSYGGFGFVITEAGSVISKSSSELFTKGDNINDKAEADVGFSEFSALVETLNHSNSDYDVATAEKKGQKVIPLCGEKYLVGWSNIDNYDTCYTFIFLPYSSIMKPFTVSAVIALSIAVIFIAASIAVSLGAAKKITKPITDAIDRLTALSKGDLESPSPVTDRNDETLVLLRTCLHKINMV